MNGAQNLVLAGDIAGQRLGSRSKSIHTKSGQPYTHAPTHSNTNTQAQIHGRPTNTSRHVRFGRAVGADGSFEKHAPAEPLVVFEPRDVTKFGCDLWSGNNVVDCMKSVNARI